MRDAEIVRSFETAFAEAGLPVSRTPSSRARPRLRLAATLPVGVEAQGEIVEAEFDEPVSEERLRAAAGLLPSGLVVDGVRDVRQGAPSAASRVRHADYEVDVESEQPLDVNDLRDAARRVMRAPALPGRRRRGVTERRADAGERDLRPLIENVEVVDADAATGRATLAVRLRTGRAGAGRPEDVVAAMRLPLRVVRVRRRQLSFVDT
jgi:radical SAM-linked protein